LSTDAQALLHVLVRNLGADHVIEIGVFKAATTESIARALHANGHGVIHAVDPYRSEYIAAILRRWPPALAAHASFHPCDSVQFFHEMRRGGIRPSLVLIDGNHDYEFAAFDIESAARMLTGGGFIAVDNIAQPGPFLAVRDFLERHPGWTECGGSTADYDRSKAYDRDRTRIHNTDLAILRAPRQRTLSSRPWSPGQSRISRGEIHGVRVEIRPPGPAGTLHAQVVLRGFGAQPAELFAAASTQVRDAREAVTVVLASPLRLDGDFTHFTVEPNLIWQGDRPLRLARDPEIF
jgi:predicted O-methyltransferase YrrM